MFTPGLLMDGRLLALVFSIGDFADHSVDRVIVKLVGLREPDDAGDLVVGTPRLDCCAFLKTPDRRFEDRPTLQRTVEVSFGRKRVVVFLKSSIDICCLQQGTLDTTWRHEVWRQGHQRDF